MDERTSDPLSFSDIRTQERECILEVMHVTGNVGPLILSFISTVTYMEYLCLKHLVIQINIAHNEV